MKRRAFLGLVGGAAAWPLAARAQQAGLPVIGVLGGVSPDARVPLLDAFRHGLNDVGYVDGRNVTIEYRWSAGHYDRLPVMAADLLARKPAMIAAFGNVAARAAKEATTTVPVVFSIGSDPVEIGLVASLNRPGANMTGVTILNNELELKRLEIMTEVVPRAVTMAFLVNPDSPTTPLKLRAMEGAALALGRRLHVLNARGEHEFERVFAALDQQRIGAMIVASDNVFSIESAKLGQVSARHTVPVISAYREFALAGGLMSYGTSLTEAYQQVGVYAGRILNGEKPANLPVQQATKIQFTINLNTAKALGLIVPLPLVGRADEVIE